MSAQQAQAPVVDLHEVRQRRTRRDEEWERLKTAVATETVDAFPAAFPLRGLPAILRVSHAEVDRAIADGRLVITRHEGIPMVLTEPSRDFLLGHCRLILPLPDRVRPPGAGVTALTFHPTRMAYDSLRELSARTGRPIPQLVADLLDASLTRLGAVPES
jgi:hypothetical protein